MSKLSKRHFWEWFERNNTEYASLNKKTKKEVNYWLNELKAHLRAYFKFLGCSLAIDNKGISTLIITVNGKAQHFEKVDAFVATAPEIPGWRINALEDPMPIDFSLEKEIKMAGIHPAEMSFSFADDDTESGCITIYHPLLTKENSRDFWRLAHAAVYNLLGERSFGLDIYELDITNLSASGDEVLRNIEELPLFMGIGKSSMIVDDEGKLIHL